MAENEDGQEKENSRDVLRPGCGERLNEPAV
jgi:hypothetical protein